MSEDLDLDFFVDQHYSDYSISTLSRICLNLSLFWDREYLVHCQKCFQPVMQDSSPKLQRSHAVPKVRLATYT